MSDDRPSSEDLAMAQAGQTAEALADLNRPTAEEQREADEETAELLQVGADALAAEDIRPTDIYSRVNTAHGAGAGAILVQNPHTFSDDIARGNLPPTAIDPHPDAQPPEPEGAKPVDEEGEEGEAVEGEEGEEVEGEVEATGLSPNAPVYPNPAHPMGTPEDLLYAETGLISTTVSNVDGVSIVEIDPEATEIEEPVAGDAAPQTPPPDDKATIDGELLDEDGESDEEEVEQVESDYDPSEHTVAEVNDYLSEHPEEADAIYAAEEAGKGRAGILG